MVETHKSTLYLVTSLNLTNGKRCQQILEQRNLPLAGTMFAYTRYEDTDTRRITHRIHIGQQLFSGGQSRGPCRTLTSMLCLSTSRVRPLLCDMEQHTTQHTLLSTTYSKTNVQTHTHTHKTYIPR